MALVYVSGYSEPMGHIKGDQLIDGIHAFRMGADGTLTPAAVSVSTAGLPNPSLVTSDSRGRFLFAINEIDDGAVSAFQIDPGTGALKFLNRVSAQGSAPCHCCVDNSDSFFFSASYGSGTVASFAIQSDGSLAPASQVVQHTNGDLQPHAHSVTMSPSNTELIAVDLGLDQVRRYALSTATGAFSLRQTLQLDQGLGTCLFTFDKTGKHAYVGNECVNNRLTTALPILADEIAQSSAIESTRRLALANATSSVLPSKPTLTEPVLSVFDAKQV